VDPLLLYRDSVYPACELLLLPDREVVEFPDPVWLLYVDELEGEEVPLCPEFGVAVPPVV
jgi:hypothetical protein